jgi:hypothetical protein
VTANTESIFVVHGNQTGAECLGSVSVGLVYGWQSEGGEGQPLFLVALDICVEAINKNVMCHWNLLTEQTMQV